MESLTVQFISHACLKITGAFGTLLCDPWFLNMPVYNFSTWKFPAAVIPPEKVVEGVDYVYITHTHEDHFHIPSINHIPRDTPILLANYANHPSLRAHTIERVLRELGFANIRRLAPWEPYLLGGITPFTSVPSATSRAHDWENSGFVIEHPDCVLLNMNDNLSDEALCAEIVERWPEIDIAFIQSVGVSMYPGCYRMTEHEMREEAAKRKIGLADQRRMMDLIRPRRVAPFAGDFCWLDEAYFHNNWANRGTPELFNAFIEQDYADRDVEVVTMLPSDTWSVASGHTRHHPPIDWDNYLDEIARVQHALRPRIDGIRQWIDAAPREDLEARSRAHTERVERWITRDFINFSGRFRLQVEADPAFGFVLKASPEEGFRIDWDDRDPVDQTLYLPEAIWAAVLDGRLTWNIIQWVGQCEQHVPYRPELGRFWFWMENHIDLSSSQTPQVLLEPRLHPHLDELVDPNKGVFEVPGEWSLPWLNLN